MIETLRKALKGWSSDNCSLLAAAMSYYLALAFFPLLLVLLSGLGFFFQWTQSGQDAEAELLTTIEEQLSPSLSSQVKTVFSQVRDKASIGGPIGLATLLATAIVLFAQIETAFDHIWKVNSEKRSIWQSAKYILLKRARAFVMLMALGIIVLAVFLSGMVTSTMLSIAGDSEVSEWFRWAIQLGVSVSLNFAVFTSIYRFLPKAKVTWRGAIAGGLCAALVWEVGRLVLSAIVVGKKYSAYGVLGAFLAIMLWAYYAMCVLFLGAELTQVVSPHQDATSEKTPSSS
ncbi:YihY/virulence factor BrkB family protein [Bythopirellula polymerisocia]|uniref:Inner membrane protein YhjD n=1 Tax=Bythopirellula polymerisocia TaxID=2528003 RepID=A0A5C6D0M6_9BACT|nr:YihY/virulence factor BrkB family protein [Bythopirellula polymerisocia]TWU30452.1 Inner membrane protein YhjD [Bythopirellula polymerisocia]